MYWEKIKKYICICNDFFINTEMVSQIAKFMGPTWGPSGSCRPQMGPMLAPWTLLSGICIWNPTSWKPRTCLSYKVNMMAADDLVMKGARASAAMVLTSFSCNNPASAPEGLTLNGRGPSYLGLTRSISWLLMPWLLSSPGHQQPWCWLCRIGRSLSYLRKDFNYLCHIIVEEWHKMEINVFVPSEKFSMLRVNHFIMFLVMLQQLAYLQISRRMILSANMYLLFR